MPTPKNLIALGKILVKIEALPDIDKRYLLEAITEMLMPAQLAPPPSTTDAQ